MTTIATDEKAIQKAKRLRKEIRFWLDQIDNPDFLKGIRALVRVEGAGGKTVTMESLPEHVRRGIEEGERQLGAGLGIPHEEVMKELDQWLNEK